MSPPHLHAAADVAGVLALGSMSLKVHLEVALGGDLLAAHRTHVRVTQWHLVYSVQHSVRRVDGAFSVVPGQNQTSESFKLLTNCYIGL